MASPSGVTFTVVDGLTPPDLSRPPELYPVKKLLQDTAMLRKSNGTILLNTESGNTTAALLGNGFVGTCLKAYNEHYHLVIKPDDVWISITTSLGRYMDADPESLRSVFVSHEGKKELCVYGGGSIKSADYDSLLDKMSEKIDESSKGDIKDWIECNFSTTTKATKVISKIVLMGVMKHYFDYKMFLCCGLPKVTLQGTLEDWKDIRQRVGRMKEWGVPTMTEWASVLEFVLDQFVAAMEGKEDKAFWNRIASKHGGGSGPRYLKGWILALIGFNDAGKYILDPLDKIKSSNSYGMLDTNDVPPCSVVVPVEIDDNGVQYKTLFYAGALSTKVEGDKVSPALDWALIDVTNAKPSKD